MPPAQPFASTPLPAPPRRVGSRCRQAWHRPLCPPCQPLDHIRSAIAFLFGSEKRSEEFKGYCKEEGKKPVKFWPDSKVRWDSTYVMLKGVLPYKDVLTSFVNAGMQCDFLSEHVWTLASKFCKFLKIFHEAATKLSAVYSHTSSSSLVLHYICDIALLFQTYRADPGFSAVVKAMEETIVKYFQTIPHLHCFAFILDPRIKLFGLERTLQMLGEALNMDYSSTYSLVADEFYRVVCLYEERFGSMLRPPPQPMKDTVITRMWKKLKIVEPPSTSPELFMWWKDNNRCHIVLVQLARDVLAVPVSTVCSADTFSMNGRIVEDRRTCLAPDEIEQITCLKDWENAEAKEQHRVVNAEFANEIEGIRHDSE